MASDTAFWTARIAAIDLRIAAYEAAILDFATNGAQQNYKFDSGQEVITVERAEPDKMNAILDSFINQRQIYCQRAGLASGGVYARGAF